MHEHSEAYSVTAVTSSENKLAKTMRLPLWNWAQKRPVLLSLVIYTAIIIAATIPTWDVYMWWGHYMLFPVVDVYEICKVWVAQGFGHVPWFPDYCFGYGYPYHTFYGPLGFYVAAILHFLFGLDYGFATRLSFYASLYLSGLLVYAFAYIIGEREHWPRLVWWALAAATIYALTRYHLTDVFVRDVMAESWAWTMLPGVYLGMEIARYRPLPGILVTSLTYAALLLSHNITALWASVFIAVYPLLTSRDLRWPCRVAAGGILGAAMSAFFWFPALRLKVFTARAGDVAAMWGTPDLVHDQAIPWQQYFLEGLGSGNSRIPGSALGTNIGFAVLIGIMLSTLALFQRGLRGTQRQRLAVFILLVFVVLFIMSPQMPWAKVPAILRYIQFPWRLLIFTGFFGAVAMALAAPVINRWIHPGVMTGLAVMFAIPTLPMILMPPVIKKMSPEQLAKWNRRWERKGVYAGSDNFDFMPKWVQGDYLKPQFLAEHPIPANRLTVTSGDLVCDSYFHRGCVYEYRYKATVDSEARIAIFYWPGLDLRIDGKPRSGDVKTSPDGLVLVKLPAGTHLAQLRYDLSPEGKSARAFSSAAVIFWIGVLFVWKFSRRRRMTSTLSTAL